jgi:endonuclease/exonuclease/phosphatase family metal-dependent hydrolase
VNETPGQAGEPRGRLPPVRLASWNLLHGRSLEHGQVVEDDLRTSAQMLDADVLALQEVDRGQPRSGGSDQAAVVADGLGARWHRFVPALWGEPGGHWVAATDAERTICEPDAGRPGYGIALVSRLPVLDWAVTSFPPARIGMPLLVPGRGIVKVDDEPRLALAAQVEGPSTAFTVIATHLSFVPGVNVRQLRSLARWAETWPAPRVLLGDLNLPGRLPAWATGWTQLARLATYPSWKPRVQFDHVLAHPAAPVAVTSAVSARFPVSDHNPVVVTAALPPAGAVP